MQKKLLAITLLLSGSLALPGCTTNPYTGESQAGKSGMGAGLGALVGAGVGCSPHRKRIAAKGR